MANLYYIRKRGRVTGPFELEELLKLKDQGRVTRSHELSTDQVTWLPAFEVDEVFQTFAALAEEPPVESGRNDAHESTPSGTRDYFSSPTDNPTPVSVPRPATRAAIEWYYVSEGERLGPVSLDALTRMAKQGDLDRDTLVWSSELPDWELASQVNQLAEALRTSTVQQAPTINVNAQPANAGISAAPAGMIYCRGCGKQIHSTAIGCPHCGATQSGSGFAGGRKHRLAYVLFALFLGGPLGIHNFYAGRMGPGVAQLLVTLFLGWFVFPLIVIYVWNIMECILVTNDGNGQPFV